MLQCESISSVFTGERRSVTALIRLPGGRAYTTLMVGKGKTMKTLLLTCIAVALFSTTASACRGTAEYPQVAVQLAQLDLPAAEKSALVKSLEAGEAIHRRGHELDRADLRQESLKILDEIKAKIAR
jgi:hypothetical protein